MNIKEAKLCGCGEVHNQKVCPKCGSGESIWLNVYFQPKEVQTEYFSRIYGIEELTEIKQRLGVTTEDGR